jgi:hypothetical protein
MCRVLLGVMITLTQCFAVSRRCAADLLTVPWLFLSSYPGQPAVYSLNE